MELNPKRVLKDLKEKINEGLHLLIIHNIDNEIVLSNNCFSTKAQTPNPLKAKNIDTIPLINTATRFILAIVSKSILIINLVRWTIANELIQELLFSFISCIFI